MRADLDAERFLLGAMLTSPSAVEDVYPVVLAEDFSRPDHMDVFACVIAAWRAGEKPEPVAVSARMQPGNLKAVGGAAGLLSMMAACPSHSLAGQYAHRVASVGVLRRLYSAAAEISELAVNGSDAAEAVDRARALLAELEPPSRAIESLTDLDSLVDSEDDPFDWVVPGLLEHGDRAVLVAPEGHGKSYLFRQFAVMCGQGIHPFTYEPIRKVRTLLVDLENPERIIRRKCRPIITEARTRPGYEPGMAWLWHQPGGINLRSRTDRTRFDAVLAHVRPELVCFGPLYKAYRARSAEKDDLVATEVTEALDDLRTRHRFALLVEHHAPKKQGGVRELSPFGSSVWMRWPEFGPKLVPEDDEGRVLKFGHWRPPRDERFWPVKLTRGGSWPWEATFADDSWKRAS